MIRCIHMHSKVDVSQLNLLHRIENKNKLECGPMPNVMAALPNIGGALCSTPQSLSDVTTRVPCSNGAYIGELKTWTQSEFCTWQNSVMEQEPPKMYI